MKKIPLIFTLALVLPFLLIAQEEMEPTLSDLDSLISVYYGQRDYEKGIETADLLIAKASEVQNDTARITGLSYYGMERKDQSESYFAQALDVAQKNFGEEHPNTRNLSTNLAGIYYATNL